MPTVGLAFEHLGFKNVEGLGREFLLGLYIGLINFLECPFKDIVEAHAKGKLPELIKERYEAYPLDNKGGYYPWFLKNESRLFPTA